MDNTIEELKKENAVLNRRLNALISVLYPTCISKDDVFFIDEQGEKESGEKPVPFPHYEPPKNSCISSTKDNRNAGITTACVSEYKPMGAILAKADNRGNEEWTGE